MLFGREGPGGDYERLVVLNRPEVGLRAIVAVHSTRRGPAFGGIRRRVYRSEPAAVEDALALAAAMSHKCALARLPAGGAKTVIMDGPGAGEDAAYERLGREIEALGGDYVCGPDVGTGTAQLDAVRRQCAHVNPSGNDAGASTAAGVNAGIRAVSRALGFPGGQPRTVAIEGLGSVGLALARALIDRGVVVTGADLDPAARERASRCGVDVVPREQMWARPCDVLCPCAMGHGLDAETIGRLRCRAVCGSANNQLATAADGDRLRERGILHAPDIVVSAGAVIEGVITTGAREGPALRQRVREAIDGIEDTLTEVFEEASRRGRSPTEIAWSIAARRLAA